MRLLHLNFSRNTVNLSNRIRQKVLIDFLQQNSSSDNKSQVYSNILILICCHFHSNIKTHRYLIWQMLLILNQIKIVFLCLMKKTSNH